MSLDQSYQVRLAQLGAYPFERLKALFATLSPNPELAPIDAGAGEPRLPLASFVADANGINPGAGYIRAALVDGPDRAAELARRLRAVRI